MKVYRWIAAILCMVIILCESDISTLAFNATSQIQEEESVIELKAEEEMLLEEGQEELGENQEIEESLTEVIENEEMVLPNEEEQIIEEFGIEVIEKEEIITEENVMEDIFQEEEQEEFISAFSTEKLTEEELFLQYPEYLNSKTAVEDIIIEKSWSLTLQALNDVSTKETFFASWMYSIKNGAQFLTKEIASACGLTGSNYDDFKKKMAIEIIKEYTKTESYVADIAGEVSKEYSNINRVIGDISKVEKDSLKKQLKESKKTLTNKEVDKIVDAAFKKTDVLLKVVNETVSLADMIISIVELQDIELTIIDELIVALEEDNSKDMDLYKGLIMVRNDITDDIATYVINNYLNNKTISFISDTLTDAIKGLATDITGVKFSVPSKVIADIFLESAASIWEKYNPSVDSIVYTTVMKNYCNTLESAVKHYQLKFWRKKAPAEDIRYFKAAYKARLCAIKLMTQYAVNLTKDKDLKEDLRFYTQFYGKQCTYERYISDCLKNVEKAMEDGTIELSSLGIVGAAYPSEIIKGKSWTCTGNIVSNYTINQVSGFILNSDQSTVLYTESVNPKSKSYSLANGVIDKALLFNKLSAGNYYYRVTAKDTSGKMAVLLETSFQVINPVSTLKISGNKALTSLEKGKAWTCNGTISSNYKLTQVYGAILESDGITVAYSKKVNPDAKSYKLAGSSVDIALKFNYLSAGTYYYVVDATDQSGKKVNLVKNQFTVQDAESTLKISGNKALTSLEKGKAWTCNGTISSNYKLTQVYGAILESDGITVAYSKKVNPDAKSYKLAGSSVDIALKFNYLSPGTYYYVVDATDQSGKKLNLIRSQFTIEGKKSTLKISGNKELTSLEKGKAWACKGIISSNYKLMQVYGAILESDGNTEIYSKTVTPNAKSYKLAGSGLNKVLKFKKLPAGTYYYVINATDRSGKKLNLVRNQFTVEAAESTLKINGNRELTSLKFGKSWTCNGTIKSNYKLTQVYGAILQSDETTVVYDKTVIPNAKSYKLAGSAVDKTLKFQKLPLGTYYYVVDAIDQSGKKRNLIRNKFTVEGKESTLKISESTALSTLKPSESWSCNGIISSNYKLTQVYGAILESDGITVVYSKTEKPNGKKYKMSGSSVNKALEFHNLPIGTYYYVVDAIDASGKRINAIKNKFTVLNNPSTLKINDNSAITSLKAGEAWTCNGTISSNYKLTKVYGAILQSDGITVAYSKTVIPNATNYKLAGSEIDLALKFDSLAVGTYYYVVDATDETGKKLNLVKNKFTVSKNNKKIYSNPVPAATIIGKGSGDFKAGGTHRGIDFSADSGSPIYVLSDGVVVVQRVNKNKDTSYGNLLVIRHTDGSGLYSLYAHMLDNSVSIKEGDAVKKGQVIGKVGSTGNVTGPHLHLELATGRVSGKYLSNDKLQYLVNPKDYIAY